MTNSLLKLFYTLLGLIIINYIIYVRLILTRMPRTLYIFNDESDLNIKLILIIITGICFSLFIIIKSIITLFHFNKNNSESKIQKMIITFHNVVDKAFLAVYQLIMNNIKDNYNIISALSNKFYNLFGKIHEGFLVFISYSIRSLILSVFLLDIFYFYELKYFYKALFLLCISLCVNLLLFILRDFANNLESAESFIELESYVIDSETQEPIIKFKPTKGNEDIDLDYHVEQFKLCSKITGYLEGYDFFVNLYNPKFNLVIYTLYFFGWFFILYSNIVYYYL